MGVAVKTTSFGIVLGRADAWVLPSLADCAYAAGFLDGEGTVFIAKGTGKSIGCLGNSYDLRVLVAQDDPRPLSWLRDRWGGSIRGKEPRANGKVNHHWACFARGALAFLRDVRPHLILKRTHADIAIRFQEGQTRRILGGAGLSDARRAEQAAAREAILRLNQNAGRLHV